MLIGKIVSPFKEFGALGGLSYAIDRILNRISSGARFICYDIVEQPIMDTPLLPKRRSKGFSLRQLEEGDSSLLTAPRPAEILRFRFAQDAICLGLFREADLIGFAWFCFGTYAEDEVRCDFILANQATQAFDFDIFIYPKHRLGFAFMALWNESNKVLGSRGIRSSISRISKFNLPSQKAHARLGAIKIGTAIFLKLGIAELMMASLKPYFHVSFTKSSRAKLYIPATDNSPT